MIPRFKPDYSWREIIAALTPLGNNDVERFERVFAKEMRQKHAIAFPYGRTGLVLLLEAMGLTGKEIICPAYTCVVVPHAIVYSNNEPVFVDSKTDDFNMDLDRAEDAITEKSGAIIATSIFGYPVDLDKIDKIRQKYPGIRIIQDCAHSFSARWKGRYVQKVGDAAIFGLNISKIINSIFGGMVTTDNDDLAKKLRAIRKKRLKRASLSKSLLRLLYLLTVYPTFWRPIYGLVNRIERVGLLKRFVKYYDEASIDMPTDYLEMMTNLEARVGIVQVSKYADIIFKRRKRAAAWRHYFEGDKDILLPPEIDGATYSHFVCLVQDKSAWIKRWRDKGVQLGELIEYAIPYIKCYKNRRQGEFPVSLDYSQRVINLPIGNDYVLSSFS